MSRCASCWMRQNSATSRPGLLGGQLGRGAVLVGGADEQHLLAPEAQVPGVDVGREHRPDEVAQVLHAVDVRQGAGDQVPRHGVRRLPAPSSPTPTTSRLRWAPVSREAWSATSSRRPPGAPTMPPPPDATTWLRSDRFLARSVAPAGGDGSSTSRLPAGSCSSPPRWWPWCGPTHRGRSPTSTSSTPRSRSPSAATGVEEDLLHWINDGLMALFFFVIGLEIKQELVTGQLNSLRTRRGPGGGSARRHDPPRGALRRDQRGRELGRRLGCAGRH